MTTLLHDLRYGFRMLAKNPGFTAVAILTLALGIGANTTVFTVVNTLILNPIPVRRASELVAIFGKQTTPGAGPQNLLELSYSNLKDLRDRNQVFSSLAGFTWPNYVLLAQGGTAERGFAELVGANYFDTLGIRPAAGRLFLPQDARAPGESPVAVISYGVWQNRFAGATDVVGRTIQLNKIPFTIIGVAPRGFLGVSALFGPDVWVPATMAPRLMPNQSHDWLQDRGELNFVGAARLKPGVTREAAEANLESVARALEEEYPGPNRNRSVALLPLNDAALSMQPTPREGGVQPLKLAGVVLMAIVGIVLLIACSNVANLLMARASSRQHELAIRLSLGATRTRISRQLLTESLLLALAGGVVGLLLASMGTRFLWSFRPAEFAQNLTDLKFNGSVFIFTLGVSVLTAFIFGIVPSLRSSRTEVVEELKDATRTIAGASRSRARLANLLLAGQVALSIISLAVAALFLRSVARASALDPGFETAHLGTVVVSPGQAGYDQTRAQEVYRELRDRVSHLAGVNALSFSSGLPLWNGPVNDVLIDGRETGQKSDAVSSVVSTVDLDYFETLRIPLVNGRDFTAHDDAGALPVAIVNQAMAQKYWPGQDPIGKRFRFSGGKFFRQIVGVARNADYSNLGEAPQSCIYLPLRQHFAGSMILDINTRQDPSTVFNAVQGQAHAIDPQLPLYDFRTGSEIIDQALWSAKMGVGLLGVFGLVALGLACVGLYGILSYSVSQRSHEIGVRMALGATRGSILRMVLRQATGVVAVGIVVGLAATLFLGCGLAALLYGVSPADPVSLAGASLALAAVAFLASYIPARRATKVDPMVALRHE